MTILYIIGCVIAAGITLWVLSGEPETDDNVNVAFAAILVGILWPLVIVWIILGIIFKLFVKIRGK